MLYAKITNEKNSTGVFEELDFFHSGNIISLVELFKSIKQGIVRMLRNSLMTRIQTSIEAPRLNQYSHMS